MRMCARNVVTRYLCGEERNVGTGLSRESAAVVPSIGRPLSRRRARVVCLTGTNRIEKPVSNHHDIDVGLGLSSIDLDQVVRRFLKLHIDARSSDRA